MHVRTLAVVALNSTQPAAHATSARVDRNSPFYRSAQFLAPSPATYAERATSGGPEVRPALQRAAPIPAAGPLPNQRIGTKREHVVRDICIGC